MRSSPRRAVDLLALAVAWVASGSCSSVASTQGTGGASSGSTSSASTSAHHSSATTTTESSTTGGCVLSELPLIVDRQNGAVTRLHVPTTYQNAPAVLLLDTGSATTFLQEPLGSPDPVLNAGTFQLGCLSVDVMGRPEVPDNPVNGVPSVGTFGTDMLLGGPSEFDFVGAMLNLHPSGSAFPDASSWPNAPWLALSGAVVTNVSLDGNPARLILDTGSQDTLWVGQQPQPGDTEVDAMDAYGNVIKLYVGTVDLGFGTTHTTVTVLRAPTFPSFQPPAPDIVGLLGLSSLGQGFVIDPDAAVVRAHL